MSKVNSIVFRKLTHADFYNINKKGGEEKGGGGQSYIDFPISQISIEDWRKFLGPEQGNKTNGPYWKIKISSKGLQIDPIEITILQRRKQTVSITSQKIHSKKSNRVPSWHPNNGFPVEYDSTKKPLIIYILKSDKNEYCAGWIYRDEISKTERKNFPELEMMVDENQGIIDVEKLSPIFKNEDGALPEFKNKSKIEFVSKNKNKVDYLEEDFSASLEKMNNGLEKDKYIKKIQKIRKRNAKYVDILKKLYGNKCQVTGEKFTFSKKDGQLYSEVHHLIPLGENGADRIENMVVVSPLVHRMLHYAKVSEIDLTKIKNNCLEITINDKPYVIKWHPGHSKILTKIN